MRKIAHLKCFIVLKVIQCKQKIASLIKDQLTGKRKDMENIKMYLTSVTLPVL